MGIDLCQAGSESSCRASVHFFRTSLYACAHRAHRAMAQLAMREPSIPRTRVPGFRPRDAGHSEGRRQAPISRKHGATHDDAASGEPEDDATHRRACLDKRVASGMTRFDEWSRGSDDTLSVGASSAKPVNRGRWRRDTVAPHQHHGRPFQTCPTSENPPIASAAPSFAFPERKEVSS